MLIAKPAASFTPAGFRCDRSSGKSKSQHTQPARASLFKFRCSEEHMPEPTSAQTLRKLDALSFGGLLDDTAMEESSITSTSSSSPHDTVEASPPSGRCLSSSPIWVQCDFDWGITFYTIKDLRGYFHIFPHVGGPFQSRDEAKEAIDRYLTDHTDLTMGIGLSEVDRLIQAYRYHPDGTKKRLKAGQPIDKRRDSNYQLVQAVVQKYNEHHNLFGDLAYEVKDVLDKPSFFEEENYRMYYHINFTAITKGSDCLDAGSDNLFFAEVAKVSGDDELTVNCCSLVNPHDNGSCFSCGSTMKHPNDGNTYAGGRQISSHSLGFGSGPPYYEDSDEEVERLRFILGGAPAIPPAPPEA